ncbi:MAG: Mu transposase C-terminal domain-containing protein [Methylovirgula sp.]
MTAISLRKGAEVQYGGEAMKVIARTDLNSVTLEDKFGHYFRAAIDDIVAEAQTKAPTTVPVDARRLEKVDTYHKAFGPLLGKPRLTRAEVKKAGEAVGIGVSAAYEAIGRFRETGNIDDLPPPTKPGGRGKSRLPAKAEAIIKDQIKKIVLTRRNFSKRKFIKDARALLEKAGHAVSVTTLRNRLAAISSHEWMKSRSGSKQAKRLLEPLKGEYPEITRPLEVIQCDHWKIDCEILGDDRLDGIGRAWATIAIDINTRTVWGLHVGLDAPSTTSVAFCMINGMLRKDAVLKEYDVKADMPIWGDPECLHLDNAGEFTGKSMRQSCQHFRINLKYRPVEEPQYGSHIERLNGNLAQRFKDMPGATGSNPDERKKLQPEKTAAFTLEDLTKEIWLIIAQYHNEPHTGIGGKTPLQKWQEYYEGPDGPRRPMPTVRIDDLSFRLHWYPLEKRKLGRHGILIDYLTYYSEELQFLVRNKKDYGWIDIRRNPLDIRVIYVLHPVRKEWIIVHTRHLCVSVASLFELRAAKRKALRLKRKPTPELLMQFIEDERKHVETSEKLTKKARREAARRAHHKRLRKAALRTEDTLVSNSEGQTTDPQNAEPDPSNPHLSQKEKRTPQFQSEGAFAPEQNMDLASLLANVTDEQLEDCLDGA